eukprot:1909794-Rhodomonas_salina.1
MGVVRWQDEKRDAPCMSEPTITQKGRRYVCRKFQTACSSLSGLLWCKRPVGGGVCKRAGQGVRCARVASVAYPV